MKRIVILVSCLLIYLNQEATNLWTYKANNRDPLEDMEEVIRATLFRTGLGYDPGTVQALRQRQS